MKIAKSSFEIWTDLDDKKVGQFIEKCARNCYKSEGAMTEDSYKHIIKNVLLAKGHESMLLRHYKQSQPHILPFQD